MSAPRFTFHGLPRVELATGAVPLGASRPIQLLAYLAVSGTWQGRDHVAQMLWPDRANKIARSNLRNLLCKLPDVAPFAPIESTQHAMRLKAPSDLDDFEAALQRQDFEATVQIGASELLQGFEASATEPYLLWLRAERETSLGQWRNAVQALLEQPGRPLEQREALAESWARRCPFDEDAVQARVRLAHEHHQAVAATKIYRAFEARLHDELGVRPSADLERFALQAPARSVRSGTELATTGSAQTRHLPAIARHHLIGRRLELRQLASLLNCGTAQLITVTGPGGVGKSTLLAAFHRHWCDSGGADSFLIDVSAAPNAKAAIVAIASALSVTVPQGGSEVDALADALGERAWLLMIDGAEQAGLAEPLAQLLERCPRTRWLLASRQRLHLDSEQLLALDGFPLPDADEADPDLLSANDGVVFFADAIAKAGRPVDMAREAADMGAIVRAVEGLPLALRLLGKLTHLFSLPQLLDSVQQQPGAGALAADSLGLGELLPSLLASFQRSWVSLSPTEQLVLARLAVFPAEFEIAAGRLVGKAELPLITSLVDRSLLRASGTGRLSLHAAIRSCVLAICPRPSADAVADYLAYYTQRLRALASLARSKTVRPLGEFLETESSLLRHAWVLALERRDHETLLSLQESVWVTDDGTSAVKDFNARCFEAEELLRGDQTTPLALRAMLLAGMAQHVYYQTDWALALDLGRRALREAQRARHYESTLSALFTLAWVNSYLAHSDQSEALISRAEATLASGGEREGLFAMGIFAYRASQALERGDLAVGVELYERSAAVARRFESPHSEFICVACIAGGYHSADMPDQAVQFEERAFAAAALGRVDPALVATYLCGLAQWNIDGGNTTRAKALMERADALIRSHPQMRILRLRVHLGHAAVFTAEGNLAAARDHLDELLGVLATDEVQGVFAGTFVVAARWFRRVGELSACVALLRSVVATTGVGANFKLAKAMLGELGEEAVEARPTLSHGAEICSAAALARQRLMQLALPMPHNVDPVDFPGQGFRIRAMNLPN